MTSLPISVEEGFTLQVKPGDHVTPGSILATRPVSREIVIDIASALHIPRKHVGKTLKKHPGDSIKKGERVAAKHRLFGMKEDEIISQVDGTFLRYERESGRIVILVHTDSDSTKRNDSMHEEKIVSPIDGVVNICNNDSILLTTDKDVLQAQFGIGGPSEGEIFIVHESLTGTEKVQLHQLGSDIIGKIVLGGIFERDALLKAIGMGAVGIIGGTIREHDMRYIGERYDAVPAMVVDEASLQKLMTWQGKRAYLHGAQKTILLLHL